MSNETGFSQEANVWRVVAEESPKGYAGKVEWCEELQALRIESGGRVVVKALPQWVDSAWTHPAALAPPSPESCPHGCYQGIIYTEDETDMTTDERPCTNPACHKGKP